MKNSTLDALVLNFSWKKGLANLVAKVGVKTHCFYLMSLGIQNWPSIGGFCRCSFVCEESNGDPQKDGFTYGQCLLILFRTEYRLYDD